MRYQPIVYHIYGQLFEPNPEPCMQFLKNLTKQTAYNVNLEKVITESKVDFNDACRWIMYLVRLGLLENSSRHCINKIGLGRFENQARAQRRVNTDFRGRVLSLINQQLYFPPLDRLYFNSDKAFKNHTDQVFKYIRNIGVQQLYVSAIRAFVRHKEWKKSELARQFRNDGDDFSRALTALHVQGLIEDRDDRLVAKPERLLKEINLITEASAHNGRRLLFSDLREIVAQQVFRGYTRRTGNLQKIRISC